MPIEKPLTFHLPDFKSELKIPIINEGVSAGFPSPSADFIEKNIDLNRNVLTPTEFHELIFESSDRS